MDVVVNLLPHVINGLALGLLFSLIALGFMLIVSVMEVINLAHGSLFALGAYVALMVLGNAATPATYALALFVVHHHSRGRSHCIGCASLIAAHPIGSAAR